MVTKQIRLSDEAIKILDSYRPSGESYSVAVKVMHQKGVTVTQSVTPVTSGFGKASSPGSPGSPGLSIVTVQPPQVTQGILNKEDLKAIKKIVDESLFSAKQGY